MPKPTRPSLTGPLKPPPLHKLAGETLGVLAVPRLIAAIPGFASLPRGKGQHVMVLPGFGGGDASTLVLRTFLTALGYKVSGWGLGINRGNVGATLPKVEAKVAAFSRRAGRPVHLVGWSLGGVFAREVARDQPAIVASVLTMGTPVVGGPKYTRVGSIYRAFGIDLDEIERMVDARNRVPIRVPVTAIWSRADGIVDWQACIDPHDHAINHVEVRGTHLSLGFDPTVLRIVAQAIGAVRQRPDN